MKSHCPICNSEVHADAKKCRHCHNYLGFSFQWVWEEAMRVMNVLAVVIAALLSWKLLDITMIAEKQKEQAQAEAKISRLERDALKEDLAVPVVDPKNWQAAPNSAQDRTLIRAATASSDLRVKQVLALAMKLRNQGIAFKMGGKSPEEGFDSSGFVAYLLADVGAIDPSYYRTFSVAKLKKSFPEFSLEKAKPGDLVFVDGNFVAIFLERGISVGVSNTKGLRVIEFSPKTRLTYRRWAYGQDIKGLK